MTPEDAYRFLDASQTTDASFLLSLAAAKESNSHFLPISFTNIELRTNNETTG